MCYAVFIGTQEEQLIDQFFPDQTVLYFDKVNPEAKPFLKSKFKNPFIYYVGSDTSCSCGLNFQSEYFHDPEWQDQKQSPQAFLNFLKDETQKSEVEYYCCWEGDWEEEPEQIIVLNINDIELDKNYFSLNERQFITFKTSAIS
ncbi:hypothetical protein [Desertivirga xinjiangensis]|uniref:hypothetical protein n=1 Tax=Desertivirga xinjiangensis TaxID=539206 RepID=UPI002108BDA5|nr:hypothetical protein [Pedobacter xinjiangensis]